MFRVRLVTSLFLSCGLLLSACSHHEKILVEEVLTKEQQAALTPDEVVAMLKEGNDNFVKGDLTVRDHSAQVRASAEGQYPKAIILSCVDSRVPVEDVFDRGIGDLFVARVAGNFENTDILGSMEFATKAAGAKVIMVLGHGYCGAVKGAIDKVELGNITPMVANIEPAIEKHADHPGGRSSKNKQLVAKVIDENVLITMDDIREKSEVIREMEEAGEIKIIGGVYDMYTGKVTFFE